MKITTELLELLSKLKYLGYKIEINHHDLYLLTIDGAVMLEIPLDENINKSLSTILFEAINFQIKQDENDKTLNNEYIPALKKILSWLTK